MASICAVAACAGCACTAFSWIRCCFGSICGGGESRLTHCSHVAARALPSRWSPFTARWKSGPPPFNNGHANRLRHAAFCGVCRGPGMRVRRFPDIFLQLIFCTPAPSPSNALQSLLNYGSNLESLTNLPGIKSVCITPGHINQCIGTSAVLRISLGCTLYFTLILPTALSEESFSGWWAAKLLVWAGLVAGCFFMPASAIDSYGQASRIFSGVFLVRAWTR